jgi:enterochelin esterase family protein
MKTLAFFSLLFYAATSFAQPGRAPQLESPIVNADRTITFKFRAPKADSVLLSAQFLKGAQHMSKDSNGVWNITVGPVKPDLYPYNFSVDGISVADPSNPYVFPNERFKASLVDVRDDVSPLYKLDNIPHGTVSYRYYYSKSLGLMRPLVIYTPPGYEEDRKSYPVRYLIHGMMGACAPGDHHALRPLAGDAGHRSGAWRSRRAGGAAAGRSGARHSSGYRDGS